MSNELDKAQVNLDLFKQKKEANDVRALTSRYLSILIPDTPAEQQLREEKLAQLHSDAAANISRHSTVTANVPPQ